MLVCGDTHRHVTATKCATVHNSKTTSHIATQKLLDVWLIFQIEELLTWTTVGFDDMLALATGCRGLLEEDEAPTPEEGSVPLSPPPSACRIDVVARLPGPGRRAASQMVA